MDVISGRAKLIATVMNASATTMPGSEDVTVAVAEWLEHPYEGVRGVALEWVDRNRVSRLRRRVREAPARTLQALRADVPDVARQPVADVDQRRRAGRGCLWPRGVGRSGDPVCVDNRAR